MGQAFFDALPWIPLVLACAKMLAAAWIVIRLYDGRLFSDRALVIAYQLAPVLKALTAHAPAA